MASLDTAIHSARILVVDDNPANTALLEGILDEAGYTRVDSTTDARTVAGLYKANRYDLILLDIRMPYMSGIEVMERLAEDVQDDYLPVLVLTAQTDRETRQRALAAGARDFLTKPFEHWEVLLRIRNMLESRIYYNGQRTRADILEELVRQRTEEVRQTQLEIIHRLGRAGEYRDNETGAHVIRMSKACQLLGQAAGFSPTQAEQILHASPMHDVGKIGIPDNILLKPGRLDPAEFDIMKRHVEIGVDILSGHTSDIMNMARVIVWGHHEKWDGSGYPRQIAGTAIPLEARIAAICDVFDALTSKRPYKEPWPLDKTMAFINEQANHHFDPELVVHFRNIADTVARLRNDHPDELILPDEAV